MCNERDEVQEGKCFYQDNSLRVKHRYRFVVRLKAIKYKEDTLYYLCSYICLSASPQTFLLSPQVLVPLNPVT